MLLPYIIDVVLNLQCPEVPTNVADDYPGYAFTAIGAAFANQGYWAQADLLDTISLTSLNAWAILLYLCAAIGGLIGVALGMPPRNYLWFFIGPAVYGWLVETQQDVRGVHWVVPCTAPARYQTMQDEVWKLAEVGIANSTLARRWSVNSNTVTVMNLNGPTRPVSVAVPFAWIDSVVSGTVYALIAWTGVTRLSAVSNQQNSNIAYRPSDVGGFANSTEWVLYADLKWPAMEEITSSVLDSEELRDAFASFFVWCGDKLREASREEALVAAGSTKGDKLPQTVFKCSGTCNDGAPRTNYDYPRGILQREQVPFPDSLRGLLRSDSPAGFAFALAHGDDLSLVSMWAARDRLTCDEYLTTLMLGVRFEAEHRYIKFYETVRPEGVDATDNENLLVTSLLYGWDIKKDRPPSGVGGTNLTIAQQRQFVRDLIMLYILRNELQLVPQLVKVREGNVEKLTGYVAQAQRTTVSKNKYTELYSWSLMLPYVQGTLLYFLAMAYPFACMLVVVPGWHKTVFTWMSFWAWVKLWDVGFAVVKSVEKSVWAMTGLNSNAAALSDRIAGVTEQVGNAVNHQCLAGSALCPIQRFKLQALGSPVEYNPLFFTSLPGPGGGAFSLGFNTISNSSWRLLDIGMTLQKSLDFDLANAYYIYIMAGLYFAVPAATGQIILGARAGAAGMVNSMISGVAGESARGATGGFQSDLATRARANSASIGQAAYGKAMASQGFALQSLGYSIAGAEQSMAQAELGAMNGALSRQGQGFGASAEQRGKAMNLAGSLASVATSFGQGMKSSLDRAAGDVVSANRHKELTTGAFGAALGGAAGGGGTGSGDGGGSTPTTPPAAPPTGETRPGVASHVGAGVSSALKDAIGALNASNSFYSGRDTLEASKALGMQSQANDIAGFKAGQTANQLGIAGRNMDRMADFSAQGAAWQTKNAFANQVNGMLSASGLMSGAIDAGPKPTDQMGMAMSGMLGGAAKSAAWHMDYNKGGFGRSIAGAAEGLNANYGKDAVGKSYNNWGVDDAVGGTFGGGWKPADQVAAGGPKTPAAPEPTGGR
jgi:hypothetical protein